MKTLKKKLPFLLKRVFHLLSKLNAIFLARFCLTI